MAFLLVFATCTTISIDLQLSSSFSLSVAVFVPVSIFGPVFGVGLLVLPTFVATAA